jgi:hypothetical protein
MLYKPGNYKNLDFIEAMKKNWAKLQECDKTAKENGELVGRYIDEPFADGKAIYQIVKENKKTVRIRVCTGLGDDWVIPYWGEEATIDKEYAVKKVAQRDALAELFRKKKEDKRYCLTCGRCESKDNKLNEEIVGVTVSKSMLEDRQYICKDNEKVLLCNECANELRL